MRSLAITLALLLVVSGGSLGAAMLPLGPEPAPTDESIATEAAGVIAAAEGHVLKLRRSCPGTHSFGQIRPIRTVVGPFWTADAATRMAARIPLIC